MSLRLRILRGSLWRWVRGRKLVQRGEALVTARAGGGLPARVTSRMDYGPKRVSEDRTTPGQINAMSPVILIFITSVDEVLP